MKPYSKTSTSHEQSMANMYIYEYKGMLSDKITYRSNLVNEIKQKYHGAFDEFDANAMNDERFILFTQRAQKMGIMIYRMIKV